MAIKEDEYQELVAAEYEWLCGKLMLEKVVLEFEPGEGLPRYGSNPRKLVITYTDGDLGVVSATMATSDPGPPTWDTTSFSGYSFWEEWRTTLWHEVCHQLQDQVLRAWDPKDGRGGHGPSWYPSVQEFARRVDCPNPRLLAELIPSM